MNTSRYTVRRLGWYQPPHGDPYTRRVPTAIPVASFDNFDDAEAHRRALEAGARAGENPFRFGGCSVFFQSSFDGPRLHDWLMDAGIDPPVSELRHGDWRVWWDAFAHTWNEEQLGHAWAAFDKVRFFDVIEEPSTVAHAVIEIVWGWLERDWNTETAAPEGGQLVGVYRRAALAEAERAERTRPRREGYGQFRYDRRFGYDADENRTWHARAATFFETVAIPTDVPPLANAGFLVQRRAVMNVSAGSGWRDHPPVNARVPVALFASRAVGLEERDRRAGECRQILNPFVFVEPGASAATDAGREELLALDLPLPLPGGDRPRDWMEWWDLCQDDVIDEQRAAVWEIVDQPLFEVLRVELTDG